MIGASVCFVFFYCVFNLSFIARFSVNYVLCLCFVKFIVLKSEVSVCCWFLKREVMLT